MPETTVGMIEASAARKPERPWARRSGVTTGIGLAAGPIMHVPFGCPRHGADVVDGVRSW